ncbi:MAG: hypothetical protein AAF415_00190 [Pseudomonadota bacterium]
MIEDQEEILLKVRQERQMSCLNLFMMTTLLIVLMSDVSGDKTLLSIIFIVSFWIFGGLMVLEIAHSDPRIRASGHGLYLRARYENLTEPIEWDNISSIKATRKAIRIDFKRGVSGTTLIGKLLLKPRLSMRILSAQIEGDPLKIAQRLEAIRLNQSYRQRLKDLR